MPNAFAVNFTHYVCNGSEVFQPMIDHSVASTTHAVENNGIGNLIVTNNLETKAVSCSLVSSTMRAKRLKVTSGKIVTGRDRMLFLYLGKGCSDFAWRCIIKSIYI